MRVRAILGLVGGLLLLVSSLAHSLLGWPVMRAPLQAGGIDPELVEGLGIGWHFGSFCTVAFAAIVVVIAVAHLRGKAPSTLPAAVIAVTCLLFGGFAMLAGGRNPAFLSYIVIGLLVAPLGFRRQTA